MADTTHAVPAITDGSRGWRWILTTALMAFGISVAAFFIYYLPAMLGRPLIESPETRVAIVAREMCVSKNIVVPTLGRETFLDLPPMPYWQVALSNTIFFGGAPDDALGMSRATLLPPAINAALAVFIVIFFGSVFWGRTSGITSGLVLATVHFFSAYAQNGNGDTVLMFSCAATVCGVALLLGKKPGLGAALLAGFGLGLGVLTKGHIPIILICIPCILELFLRRRTIVWTNSVYLAMALMMAILIATPWFVLVGRAIPDAIDRMSTEAMSAIVQPHPTPNQISTPPSLPAYRGFSFYFPRMAMGLLPWTPLILLGFSFTRFPMKSADLSPRDERETARFFVLYSAIGFLLLLVTQKKSDYYLLPLLPSVALATGAMFGNLNSPGGVIEERMGWTQLALGFVGALIIGCAPNVVPIVRSLGLFNNATLVARIHALAPAPGIGAILLAFGFFALCFLCARFWASGRGFVAIVLLSTLTLGYLVYVPLCSDVQKRSTDRWSEFDDLKKKIDHVPTGARFYCSGLNYQSMIFYTARLVRNLNEITSETPDPGIPAYVIVYGQTTTLYDVQLPESALTNSDHFSLIELSPALESQVRDAIQKFNSNGN